MSIIGTVFQSTPPVKAATSYGGIIKTLRAISIHAAREGGDGFLLFAITTDKKFNPRRP